jgi:glycosyltransferase involved in cell wall biosynthesis
MHSENKDPKLLSVIVPVYNAEASLRPCLQALLNSSVTGTELLVVDDASTDASVSIARDLGVRVMESNRRKGPAGARNAGAEQSSGSILLFIDSDITVTQDTIPLVLRYFEENPNLAALFGSYDQQPQASNFLSQYKNLFHHYIHQISREETGSFWAGCGAIRKDVFFTTGGFNETMYSHPSIEDIELGMRLQKRQLEVRLKKDIQVKHWKRWTISSLLKSDIFDRAIPWTRLIVQSGKIPNDLNLQSSHRISALLVGVLFLGLMLLVLSPVWQPWAWYWTAGTVALILFALIILNRRVYGFFFQHRGGLFTVGAVFWHLFYYFYSSLAFVAGTVYYKLLPSKHSEFSRGSAKMSDLQ